MKTRKYIYSPLLLVGALSLSACVMFGDGDKTANNPSQNSSESHANMQANQQSSDQTTVEVKADKNSAGVTPSSAQPSATIDLESKDNRVYAHVVTNWGNAKEGSLAIKWIPPQGSNCQESSFVITKYKDSGDDTWAYRTYNSSVHQCSGVWQAQVISDDGNILSSSEVNAK